MRERLRGRERRIINWHSGERRNLRLVTDKFIGQASKSAVNKIQIKTPHKGKPKYKKAITKELKEIANKLARKIRKQ